MLAQEAPLAPAKGQAVATIRETAPLAFHVIDKGSFEAICDRMYRRSSTNLFVKSIFIFCLLLSAVGRPKAERRRRVVRDDR